MSNRNPVIFVFLFLVVKPDCKFFCFSVERLHSVGLLLVHAWGDKGGEWAVMAVRVSSFQFLMTKKMLMKADGGAVFFSSVSSRFFLFFFLLFVLLFCLFVSLKKESPDGCKAKNHKYWVPSFGEFNVFSSVKSSAQRQHYLVVLLVFVRIWMPSPMAGCILEVYLFHLEAEKTKKKMWQNSH